MFFFFHFKNEELVDGRVIGKSESRDYDSLINELRDSKKMSFKFGKSKMKSLYYSIAYPRPEKLSYDIKLYDEIGLKFPGSKPNKGDYQLWYDGDVFSHSDMCLLIHDRVRTGIIKYEDMRKLLEETYYHGLLLVDGEDKNYRIMRELLFWMTLQEEINYPKNKGGMSYKLPFLRYAEALSAAGKNPPIKMQDVRKRAGKRGNEAKDIKLLDTEKPITSYYNLD